VTSIHARANSYGVDWDLSLDRGGLLPGTTARGSVTLVAPNGTDGRGLIAALVATEQWQFQETTSDAQGRSSTHTVTRTEELRRLPVQLADQLSLAPGERLEIAFEVPVPRSARPPSRRPSAG
jgi:hypothetical protein